MSRDPSHTQPAIPDDGSTSRSLLTGVRGDDPASWNRLVTLYAPLVAYWCRQGGVAEDDVADVLQDVFRAVAANIARFRSDFPGCTFRGWLRIITRRKVVDLFRARSQEPEAVGGTEAHRMFGQIPSPIAEHEDSVSEPAAERALLLRAVARIRSEFEEHTWQAFWRTAIDDCTATDVASELAMTPGAVRVAKCRVLHRLREELGELKPDGPTR